MFVDKLPDNIREKITHYTELSALFIYKDEDSFTIRRILSVFHEDPEFTYIPACGGFIIPPYDKYVPSETERYLPMWIYGAYAASKIDSDNRYKWVYGKLPLHAALPKYLWP